MTNLLRLLLIALLVPPALVGCSTYTDTDAGPGTASSVRVVAADEAAALLDEGAQLVDVRTPAEFAAGHLAGAANVDVQAPGFADRIEALPRDETYVLYCRSGARAGAAGEIMLDLGFTDVVNAGGFDALAAGGLPTQ